MADCPLVKVLVFASAVSGAATRHLWAAYKDIFFDAKYVDLTHALEPFQLTYRAFGMASVQGTNNSGESQVNVCGLRRLWWRHSDGQDCLSSGSCLAVCPHAACHTAAVVPWRSLLHSFFHGSAQVADL